ncbi:MAG: SurA N-terminal domain-containing protein [Fimbriimonadaceae bacterium]|nr:SurA N-terminal domain-containing protein [Fimbriimonadaceae bacterium]
MKSKGLYLLASALVAFTIVGCNKDKGEIAKVNGIAITNSELIEYLEAKPTVRVVIQGQTVDVPVQDTLGFQAMQDLVVRKLVQQMAKEEGVAPTKKEVDEEISLRGEINPGYVKNLQARGLSMTGIRAQVEVELAQQLLVSKGITVTDQEVEDYIKANKAEFQDPAKVEMYWILATSANKAAIDSELATGAKFQDVAARLSMDPEAKASGGKFGAVRFPSGVPINALDEKIRNAVSAAPIGKGTDWVSLPQAGQVAKFYVIRRTEARDIEMTAARKKLIKRGIAVARGQETKDIKESIQKRLKDAKITVSDSNLKGLWEAFEKNLKKAADDTKMPSENTPPAGN